MSAIVKAVLEETRNETKLHPALVGHSLTHLMGFASGETPDEVKECLPETTSEWYVTFHEAWEGATKTILPRIVGDRAVKCGLGAETSRRRAVGESTQPGARRAQYLPAPMSSL